MAKPNPFAKSPKGKSEPDADDMMPKGKFPFPPKLKAKNKKKK